MLYQRGRGLTDEWANLGDMKMETLRHNSVLRRGRENAKKPKLQVRMHLGNNKSSQLTEVRIEVIFGVSVVLQSRITEEPAARVHAENFRFCLLRETGSSQRSE